jgi:cytochrome c oxidase subunit II
MRMLRVMAPLLALVTQLAHAGAAAAGRTGFLLCQSCHGSCGQGNRELNAPRLAGLDAAYLERQLLDFSSGRRGAAAADVLGAQMAQMAKTLSDKAAVSQVAAYAATLSAPSEPATPGGDLTSGKALFSMCAACHGPAAEGNPALQTPRLAGMSSWYLLRQLEAFRAGWRGVGPADSPGARMRMMAMTLADGAALRDVIAYINSIAPRAAPAENACRF